MIRCDDIRRTNDVRFGSYRSINRRKVNIRERLQRLQKFKNQIPVRVNRIPDLNRNILPGIVTLRAISEAPQPACPRP